MFEAGTKTTAHDDIDITIISGRSSDNPIKLGDELKISGFDGESD